jgi:hypothetical protein
MLGIHAITTSKLKNANCIKLSKIEGTVCSKCYADRSLNAYSRFREHTNANTLALSSKLLNDHDLPRVDNLIFRFETHGDIVNKTHIENYVNICKVNPRTRFTLWSKRVTLLESYFTHNPKPKNLTIIHSSSIMNVEDKMPFYADKVFTVYDKKAAEGVKINCSRACADCRLCYDKNNVKQIRELIHK